MEIVHFRFESTPGMSFKLSQLAKACSPIAVTLSGMVISQRPLSKKASSPIDAKAFGSVMPVKFRQDKKAPESMRVTLGGMETSVRLWQSQNA